MTGYRQFRMTFIMNSHPTLTKIVLIFSLVLIVGNLEVLGDKIQKLEEKKILPEVMGTTTVTCPKKAYIPLGAGTVKSQDWQDTGAQVYIDPLNFPGAKSFVWEASFKIPTANGRVYGRLINVYDNKVEIWGSEISFEGANSTLIASAPINLWQGNKLYRVQLKTSMDYEAVMEGGRIVVTY